MRQGSSPKGGDTRSGAPFTTSPAPALCRGDARALARPEIRLLTPTLQRWRSTNWHPTVVSQSEARYTVIRTSAFYVVVGSSEPIYQQLVAQVKRLIASGELKPGDKLPSVRDLGRALTINPMSVSKAFVVLEAEAFLQRQTGRGMVVPQRNAAARSIPERVSIPRPTLEPEAQESR